MKTYHRYKIGIEYDGSSFCGWQRQDVLRTVQGCIEEAIQGMTGQKVLVEGAGRTDTGVHATGQVGHFDLDKYYPPHRIQDGLNFYLKGLGVVIFNVEKVDPPFHARFSATSRTYHYHILNRRSPSALDRFRAWHVVMPLDFEAMKNASKHLVGHHDFSAFRSSKCQSNNPVKTLTQFDIHKEGDRLTAIIKARSFLHNQVRVMMGTLKMIGSGHWEEDDLLRILLNKDRIKAGPTAPPHGLYLVDVGYEK